MDDEQAVRALHDLRDDEGGPPLVDLAAAMQVGRGRLRRRRTAQLSVSAAVAVAVVAAAPATLHLVHKSAHSTASSTASAAVAAASPSLSPSAGPTSLACVEAGLPVPEANQMAVVSGADPTGHYMVGRVYKNDHPSQVIIWHDGQFKALTMPGSDPLLKDVTSAGVAVGYSENSGWIYQDGRLTKLKGPYGAQAIAIADNGTIAGNEETLDGPIYPIVWHSSTSTAVRLPLPGPGWQGQVNDVDSDGTIVGTVGPSMKPEGRRGIVWHPDGSYQLLPLPTEVVVGADELVIYSIRRGTIVAAGAVGTSGAAGAATDKKPPTRIPVLYRLSTGGFAPLPKANLSVYAGNAQGWIVGESGPSGTPTVYTPATGNVPLPTLVPHTLPLAGIPSTISDNGLIIGGQDTDAKDVIHAVRWTCH